MASGSHLQTEYDVIVVGGGGSGLAAACAAAQRGGRVLVLEKQADLGGTTAIAVGSLTAAATSLQRTAGVEDHVDWHAEDVAKFAAAEIEARNNDSLRRHFLSEAAATYEWLREMGLSFYGPSPEPPNRVPRMHNVVPGARAYIATLRSRLLHFGGAICVGTEVDKLLFDGRRVIGVRTQLDGGQPIFHARRGVVLAGGDYAANGALIAKYKGDEFSRIEGVNPGATGNGHQLAADAGGRLVNMDVTYGPELRFVVPDRRPLVSRFPAGRRASMFIAAIARHLPRRMLRPLAKRMLVTWQHPEDSLFRDGAILINRAGERFTNELKMPAREIDVARQPRKETFILLDDYLVDRYSQWPNFISTAPDIAYAYVADYLRLRKDITTSAHSLEALARHRKLDPMRLSQTIDAYNANARQGRADPFGRHDHRRPLGPGPWVLMGPAKAFFTTTEGGAAVDRCLRVLDGAGRPIPGLHAVGQNGLGGIILWGHGLHISWAITSGRLAGQHLMSASPLAT